MFLLEYVLWCSNMVHKMLLYLCLCLASVIICNVHNSVQGCVYCCIVCVCVCMCVYLLCILFLCGSVQKFAWIWFAHVSLCSVHNSVQGCVKYACNVCRDLRKSLNVCLCMFVKAFVRASRDIWQIDLFSIWIGTLLYTNLFFPCNIITNTFGYWNV